MITQQRLSGQERPNISTWLHLRRAERAVRAAARRRGIHTPDLYALDDDEPTRNCLSPLGLNLYGDVGSLPDYLRPVVRRWCESVARAAGGGV